MSDQLVHISARGPIRRVLVLLPLLFVLVGGWFSVRWYIGNTIAEYVNPDDRTALDTARLAVGMAPGDPLTHWALALAEQNRLSADQSNQSISEFEQAVKLSPNDYRFWLALGRALEQTGDTDKAEKAMRRAVALAPSYSYPRWYLGNLMLRSGRDAEAFAELQRATEADPQLRPQVFNLAWEVFRKDPGELTKAIGTSAEARAQFAKYLFDSKQVDAGLSIWSGLTAADKQANRAVGEAMLKDLAEAKRFRQAMDTWNDLTPSDAARARPGQLLDGGFELNSGGASSRVFGWQTTSRPQLQVTIDTAGDQASAHGGSHSLHLLFKVPRKITVEVSQLVVVDPDTQFELEGFIKTSKLESGGTPIIEILDAADGYALATSTSAPTGDNDWQQFSVPFKTGAKTEAIVIRINRASCADDNSVCPIFGSVWYDDFDLKRRS
jgi:cytochrome c-type biogenesis protein CcmH/NrfG